MAFEKRHKKAMNDECREILKIHGIVIPAGWDEKGNVTAISIFTFDEQEYIVEKDKIGKQLMSSIREEVDVSGILQIKKDNTKKIIVKEFSLKNSYE